MEKDNLSKSVMEFVKVTIKNPEILEDEDNAKRIAKKILHKNMKSANNETEEKRA